MREKDDGVPSERRQPRVLTQLDMVLLDLSGAVLDDKAQAHDIGPAGFRVETKTRVAEGTKFAFTMKLDDDEQIKGQAKVVWVSEDQWGWYNAGAKITKMSWRDGHKIRGRIYAAGYDFFGLAKLVFKGFYWAVIVFGLESLIVNHPHARKTLIQLLPILPAALILGWSLRALLRKDD